MLNIVRGLFIFGVLAASISAFAMPTAPRSSRSDEMKKTNSESTVLKLIDDECADSWCESDYNFKFVSFFCHETSKKCSLSFTMTDHENQPVKTDSKYKLYMTNHGACEFDGTGKAADLLETSQNGYVSLKADFNDRVSDCLSAAIDQAQGK